MRVIGRPGWDEMACLYPGSNESLGSIMPMSYSVNVFNHSQYSETCLKWSPVLAKKLVISTGDSPV